MAVQDIPECVNEDHQRIGQLDISHFLFEEIKQVSECSILLILTYFNGQHGIKTMVVAAACIS